MLKGIMILSISLSVMTLGGLVSCGEDRRFEEQRLVLANRISSVLVEEGICEKIGVKCGGEIFFVAPASYGVKVILYGITNKSAIQKIVNECAELFFRFDQKMTIYLNAYKITKEEELRQPRWTFNKPYITIEFIGEIK